MNSENNATSPKETRSSEELIKGNQEMEYLNLRRKSPFYMTKKGGGDQAREVHKTSENPNKRNPNNSLNSLISLTSLISLIIKLIFIATITFISFWVILKLI